MFDADLSSGKCDAWLPSTPFKGLTYKGEDWLFYEEWRQNTFESLPTFLTQSVFSLWAGTTDKPRTWQAVVCLRSLQGYSDSHLSVT